MSKPLITIHNTETDQIETREMNVKEFSDYNQDLIEAETKQAEAETRATARQVILDRLGLTADEAALLLG